MTGKWIAMIVAAVLTGAAMAARGGGGGGQPDPTLSSPGKQALNLETWETFRVFYSAVLGAYRDGTSWADPSGSPPLAGPGVTLPVATGTK